ncbi:MAG: virion core protein, T7 gp14 family [Cetobacterium sp.]
MVAAAGAQMGLSVLGAVTSIIGQTQQYNAQKDHANKLVQANRAQMQENRDLATQAFLDQSVAAHRQLGEQQEMVAVENFDKSRAALKARGEVLAAAAESGVGGNSLHALVADFHRQEGFFLQRNEQNLLMKKQQTASVVKGYHTEAVGRTNAIKPIIPSPISRPDYLGPILAVGGKAASLGSQFAK